MHYDVALRKAAVLMIKTQAALLGTALRW